MKRAATAMKRPSRCEGDVLPFKRAARGDVNSSGASQPAEVEHSSGASQPAEVEHSSGASQPAEVEQLVAEVRELGHFPKDSNPAEKNLYKRLYYKRGLFSEEQWTDLKNSGELDGEASHDAADVICITCEARR
jgi:hypothetical protein